MKTKPVAVAVLSLLAFAHQLFAQGSLTPPGAPAPTMKSLDDIYFKLESRTPVNTSTTPGDALNLFIISQPGSYYLTSNIVGVSSKDGIKITTNNITLDLNGFSMRGSSGSFDGILVPSGVTCSNIVIRNGAISSWGEYGIQSSGDIVNSTFENLNVSFSATVGIECGNGCVVRNCSVNGNVESGIYVHGSGCLVVGNICTGNNTLNNSGYAGILVAGANNRIDENHVTGSGTSGNGIQIFSAVGNTNNVVIRNSVSGGGVNNYSFNNLTAQAIGPLITNTASGIITNSNPWANFSF